MLTRLTHAAIAFAITAVCYQVYALTVVPRVTPPGGSRRQHVSYETPRTPPHKYRELLASYLPAGHWALVEPPKTFQNGQVMIVADIPDGSEPAPNGQLRIARCLMIAFPGGWQLGQKAPRDAILMEAPSGAVINLDPGSTEGEDGSKSVSIGKFQRGKLLGTISIRSNMEEPGPQDDLLITTREISIDEDGINTPAAVELRLGQHYARGRGLRVTLLPPGDDRRKGSRLGPFEMLEITDEVSVDLAIDESDWLQASLPEGESQAPRPRSGSLTLGNAAGEGLTAPTFEDAKPKTRQPVPPVRIRSTGPFTFDFLNYIASFRGKPDERGSNSRASGGVQIRQVHPDGKLDQLLAREVNLYFTESSALSVQKKKGQVTAGQRLGKLQPATVEAKGAPVILDAPSREATARCERLRLLLDQRGIIVDGGDEVTLTMQGHEIHAPMVQYHHPPQGSPNQVGDLLAAGRGWLRAVVDKNRPGEPLEVSWRRSMQLKRIKGKPVLSLEGRPKLDMPAVGRLWADEMKIYLLEDGEKVTPKTAAAFASVNRNDKQISILPERMVASGHVEIQSPEIIGKVNTLSLWMDYREAGSSKSSTTSQNRGESRSLIDRGNQQRRRSYGVVGDRLEMQVAVQDRRPDVANIHVEGNVLFQEYGQEYPADANQAKQEPPMRIAAGSLEVTGADTPDARIAIKGRPVDRGKIVPAEIEVRGTTIRAAELVVNRGSSRARIDSPGEVIMLTDRDFNGGKLAKPQRTYITWQESMQLNGDLLAFRGDVRVRNPSGWMQTRQLGARLTSAVSFDGASADRKAANNPELAELSCTGGVLAEFDDRDTAGLTSHQRVELQSLSVNQITGAIAGRGPGRIESTHLSKQSSSFGRLAGNVQAESSSGQRLRYLRTDFTREVQGNLHQKRVKLVGNVKTVYGPVDAWEQKLPLAGVDGPRENTVWINCDELEVAESPTGRLFAPPGGSPTPRQQLGPLELAALGRVSFEAQHPTRGLINARANRATYDQAKTLFVLEGNPVTIAHQEFVGAPVNESTAKKLQYWTNTGEMKGTGIKGSGLQLDFDKFNAGKSNAGRDQRDASRR